MKRSGTKWYTSNVVLVKMNFTFSFLPILGSINLEVSPVGEIIFIDALLGFLIHALIDKVLISLGIFSSNSLISPTLIKLADTWELDAPSFPTPATITIPLIFPTEVIYLDNKLFPSCEPSVVPNGIQITIGLFELTE